MERVEAFSPTELNFGFCVMDFDGRRVTIRYRNDEGMLTRTETIA